MQPNSPLGDEPEEMGMGKGMETQPNLPIGNEQEMGGEGKVKGGGGEEMHGDQLGGDKELHDVQSVSPTSDDSTA